MAGNQLAPAEFFPQEQHVSAPSSADFYSLGGGPTHDMHQRPVDFKDGLVDPSILLEFMDSCHCEELSNPRSPGMHDPEFHHLYFPKGKFRKYPTFLVRRLRNHRYNLVEMLSCQEDLYHQTVTTEVPRDQIDHEAAETFVEEAGWLTDYAASSLMAAKLQTILERSNTTRVTRAFLAARLAIVHEMMQSDQSKVENISLVDESIVNGALAAYLTQQREQGLEEYLETRLAENGSILTPKIYDASGLRYNSNGRLQSRIMSGSFITRKLLNRPIPAEVASY